MGKCKKIAFTRIFFAEYFASWENRYTFASAIRDKSGAVNAHGGSRDAETRSLTDWNNRQAVQASRPCVWRGDCYRQEDRNKTLDRADKRPGGKEQPLRGKRKKNSTMKSLILAQDER